MSQIRTRVDLHKINQDITFYENMAEYQSIKASCLSSYHVDHDFQKELQEASDYLTKWQAPNLMERANYGDAAAILELAVRYLSGCGTRKKSVEGTLYVTDAFTDPSCDPSRYVGNTASRSLMAQAHSLAARSHYEKFLASPAERTDIQADERRFSRPETLRLGIGQPPLSSLALAAHHANESVKHGLVSPAVLLIGFKLRDLGEVLGVDVDRMNRAKRFRPLWRAISQRVDEIHAEERKRQRKADARPNQYACAAEGCGIRGEQRAALRACAGRCPADLKPSYCSKECQTKDWARHKPICKPGSSGKAPKVTADKTKMLELFELGQPDDGDDDDGGEGESAAHPTTEDREVPHGPPRVIDIPAPNMPGHLRMFACLRK
ncbi:hypothetical protein C8Q74DRAFT_592247 [Fomes fomentarius]|nr:hypothetical protein C8Q74DRAFT_592247 [Fomes fomentarius]